MLSRYWVMVLGIAVILLLVILTKTKIELLFQRYGDENDYLSIKVTLLKYVTIKKEFPVFDIVNIDDYKGLQLKSKKILSEEEDTIKIDLQIIHKAITKTKVMIENLHHTVYKLRKVFRGFKIEKFRWTTQVGFDDAALLASTIGGVWILKGTLLHLVFYFFPLVSKPDVSVNPEYHQNLLKTQLHCIFHFKVGYAIYAGIKLLYMYKKGVSHV